MEDNLIEIRDSSWEDVVKPTDIALGVIGNSLLIFKQRSGEPPQALITLLNDNLKISRHFELQRSISNPFVIWRAVARFIYTNSCYDESYRIRVLGEEMSSYLLYKIVIEGHVNNIEEEKKHDQIIFLMNLVDDLIDIFEHKPEVWRSLIAAKGLSIVNVPETLTTKVYNLWQDLIFSNPPIPPVYTRTLHNVLASLHLSQNIGSLEKEVWEYEHYYLSPDYEVVTVPFRVIKCEGIRMKFVLPLCDWNRSRCILPIGVAPSGGKLCISYVVVKGGENEGDYNAVKDAVVNASDKLSLTSENSPDKSEIVKSIKEMLKFIDSYGVTCLDVPSDVPSSMPWFLEHHQLLQGLKLEEPYVPVPSNEGIVLVGQRDVLVGDRLGRLRSVELQSLPRRPLQSELRACGNRLAVLGDRFKLYDLTSGEELADLELNDYEPLLGDGVLFLVDRRKYGKGKRGVIKAIKWC